MFSCDRDSLDRSRSWLQPVSAHLSSAQPSPAAPGQGAAASSPHRLKRRTLLLLPPPSLLPAPPLPLCAVIHDFV